MLRQRRDRSNLPARKSQVGITIKFVGDAEQNIGEIVASLVCSEQCRQEVRIILGIYSEKIGKLREERKAYREVVGRLEERVRGLEEERERGKQREWERCTCYEENTEKYSLYKDQMTDFEGHSQLSVSSPTHNQTELQSEDQMLMSATSEAEGSLSVSKSVGESGCSVSEQQLGKLMRKFNISGGELQQILQDYEREHRQASELFDSQKQVQLFRLGQRMQRDLWNKKVLKDVRNISTLKHH